MTGPESTLRMDVRLRERTVRSILERAAPLLAVHAARRGPAGTLASWLRPALATAAVIAVVATAFLAAGRSSARAEPSVSEALGYPAPIVGWVETGRRPTVEEILVTMEVIDR